MHSVLSSCVLPDNEREPNDICISSVCVLIVSQNPQTPPTETGHTKVLLRNGGQCRDWEIRAQVSSSSLCVFARLRVSNIQFVSGTWHTCGLVHARLVSLNNVFQYLSICGNAFHRRAWCMEYLINDWFLPTQLASFSAQHSLTTFWFSFDAFMPLHFSPSLPLVKQLTWHDCLLFLPFISLMFTNTVLQTKISKFNRSAR